MTQNNNPAATYLPSLPADKRQKKNKILTLPIEPARLDSNISVADLVDQMAKMSVQARNVGQCARVWQKMLDDPRRPTILLGLAGPLIAAGLRKVIRDLVVGGYVDVIVSTGAILYQDIYQARGFKHFRGSPNADDKVLRELYINRIYDTYVDEEKFWETDLWCGKKADELAPARVSSRFYLDHLGSKLDDDESIVAQCHRLGVPIFAPAINDSSIGIGLTEHYHRMAQKKKPGMALDSIRDNYELTQIVVKSAETAAIYVAGGVPKNYINDSVVMGYIFGRQRGHAYALQVTTDSPHWGGLSGSTLGEAQSWGKIDLDADFAMAFVEPSVSLPLLAAYVMARCDTKARGRLRYEWQEDRLVGLTVVRDKEKPMPQRQESKKRAAVRV